MDIKLNAASVRKVMEPNTCCRGCKCRHIDFLGEPVLLSYKGSSQVQSGCGALCSLFVVLIILLYLGNAVTTVVFQVPGQVS